MSKNKTYKCPYCDKRYPKEELIDHIDKEHQDLIPEKYSSARLVFNLINKKDHGTCIVCGKETDWNEKTYKYNRLCNNPKCREYLRKQYEKNMIKVYNKTTLLDDPKQQEKMLSNRKISGKYKFKDGGVHIYTGSYEKKALEFMDKVMNIPSTDILSPGPKFKYEYNGKNHIWITDIYYIPYNLVIEIKDGGDNPNNREMISYREKQVAKEKMITDKGAFNYIRLTNNNFAQLMYIMAELKMKLIDNDKSKSIKINEYCAAVGSAIPSLYSDDSFIINRGERNSFVNNTEYINFARKYITSKKKKPIDNTDQILDDNSISSKIRKYNIYRIKDESVLNKEMLSNDQLEYDNMVEEININKFNSLQRIAEATTMQEFKIATKGTLLYLPVMNPFDIIKKKKILVENTELDILEDIDGYFLFNKDTGSRDQSFKDINDINVDDSALLQKDLDLWSLIGNKTILDADYSNEDELEYDWLNYNSMYKKLRRESDWKSLEVFGKTNPERYKELKAKFMKSNIDPLPSENDYNGHGIRYNAGITEAEDISSNIEIHPNAPENSPSDNIQNIPLLKYTQKEIDAAKNWSIAANRYIITPQPTLDALEKNLFYYNSMHKKLKRESDWKSIELFGVNNETHYNYLKNRLSKASIPDKGIDKEEDSVSSDNDIKLDDINTPKETKEVIPPEDQKETVITSKEPIFVPENCFDVEDNGSIFINEGDLIQTINVSSIPDAFMEVPPSDLLDLPYFSPFELDDLGIFVGENNRFSSNPDNTKLEYGTPKKWFEEYKKYFISCGLSESEEYQKLNLSRIHKLQELYSDYALILDSENIDKINARKQSILELGWNPEIEFDEATRVRVDRRVNNIINECVGNVSFIDISEAVNDSPFMDNEEDLDLKEVFYRPVYIVFIRSENLFGKLIKLFKRGTVTHTAIGFNPSLTSLYSFNGLKDGFNIESIKSYENVKNLKVFVVLVGASKFKAIQNNVNYFLKNRSKTFYNYLGVISLGLQNKSLETDKMTMFCSQFVDRMLKLAHFDFTKKDSSLVTPYGLYTRLRKKQQYVYKLYDGPIDGYNENKIKAFLKKYLKKILASNESFASLFGYDDSAINESKEFPVQFDNEGNLLISKKLNVDFEKEYNDSHKLLMIYDKSKNYTGMKYELSKLWYLNSLIERKIFGKPSKNKDLYKARARILNDFNKYLSVVTKNEKNFNFTKYYENTPFNDATIKIRGTTLKYGIEAIKSLFRL